MAQKVQILLVDDLDGGEAEETVTFGIDGSSYEIDLNTPNAKMLREALTPFVEAARKATGPKRSNGKTTGRTSGRGENARIRDWAKAAGKSINERGRIPQAVMDEYRAANG
ncbi:Lsr2 protein [Murinocardiopsis flavida]|uniref:Lsr2 protein n=1 Tax=Murinocardiopsis flavida TaxID=645275 RepID=A0A2P8DG88_9ACTN|nr:Lsr2 family protein [Murinocardiopsis flavida]PSK96232.1 Lsr2 protein [Murinocardiopsis flavida]